MICPSCGPRREASVLWIWLVVIWVIVSFVCACGGQTLDDWTHAAIPTERPSAEPTGDLERYVSTIEGTGCAAPDYARFRQLSRPLRDCVADAHCIDAETAAIEDAAGVCSDIVWPKCRPWLAVPGCETEAP